MAENSLERPTIDTVKGIKGERGEKPKITYHPLDNNGKPIIQGVESTAQNYNSKAEPVKPSEAGNVVDIKT